MLMIGMEFMILKLNKVGHAENLNYGLCFFE